MGRRLTSGRGFNVVACPACGDADDCDCSRARVERVERSAARRADRERQAGNAWAGALHPIESQEEDQRWEREERRRHLERKRREEEDARRERERAERLEAILSQDFKVEMGRGDKWFEADLVKSSVTEKWRLLPGAKRPSSRITISSGKGDRGQYSSRFRPSVRLGNG